ncbi:uncharacterized protein LOC124416025 [Diprion similis]|uniref:uncharacterized protein LOC124416025 n=1 Tax=Diprion similis TaxID=362088 RepID=UPI001EF84E74|nr:uncharacterized protein LOC124416025 [Diprion similis]
MKILFFIAYLFFVDGVVFGRNTGNEIQSLDYEPDIEPYDSPVPTERPIFKYQKNGIKLDLKIVPFRNDTDGEDDFPSFPAKDIGICVLDLSLTCVQQRFHNFLDQIRRLKEITLFGNWVKLVRTKEPAKEIGESRSLDFKHEMNDVISRDIDSFFDVFALRINLPSIQGNKKKNQIDVMFDETGLVEGRGKAGKGGKGGGGKCKKMMMMMLMMMKMKMMGMMGMTAMKSMMMAGMSLMISKWMLIQKLMDLKKGGGGGGSGGGPWQGGGGGGGGGGAPLKEIVLLTKSTGGGGGGTAAPMDSYGAPPPSSGYGAPAGGWDSGGSGGAGGWGRSLNAYESISNSNSRIELPGLTKARDVPAATVDKPDSDNTSHQETRRTDVQVPVYQIVSPIYRPNIVNGSAEMSVESQSTPRAIEKNKTMTEPLQQSKFITMRSSYRVAPIKDTRNALVDDSVSNPVNADDWKNFELAKRWTASQQYSVGRGQAERPGQDSFDINYEYPQNHQPYRRLMKNGNIVPYGL